MKRIIFITLIIATAILSSTATITEKGVSKSCALMRKQHVSEVRYDISLNIPDGMTLPVTGITEITFDWTGDTPLPLDYGAEEEGTIIYVDINGKRIPLAMTNEHLILPKESLVKGKNSVKMAFRCNDKTINRHKDYLYTLFVPANARYAMPCFDQPDLKARFNLSINAPTGWKTSWNNTDKPLPTYLFSFVAGKFEERKSHIDSIPMRALYREGNENAEKYIDEAFEIMSFSKKWMEEYTGIKYPFDQFDFIVLPGYQFGGMEHPGIIQFNERRIFLGSNPTPDELNARFNLISHETSHMWFGDMVTMKWFDDVWTKEVFANFMAAKIYQAMYPEYDDALSFVRSHYSLAYSTDRTQGSHPVQQHLDNLNNAGLLYGNIIYHKAPIVMRMMEKRMGEDKLREALQLYLSKYKYNNATWDNLVGIMDSVAPKAKINGFDHAWIKEAGMPVIDSKWEDGILTVTQTDPLGRGLVWPQSVNIGMIGDSSSEIKTIEVNLDSSRTMVEWKEKPTMILPNVDGLAYGRFTMQEMDEIPENLTPLQRLALSSNIFENFKLGRFSANKSIDLLTRILREENDELVASSLCSYLFGISSRLSIDEQMSADQRLFSIMEEHGLDIVKKLLMRGLMLTAHSPKVCAALKEVCENRTSSLLSHKDYLRGAYHMAIVFPDEWENIIESQRKYLSTADEKNEYDYISRGCNPDKEIRRQLFMSLIEPSNRINEPWVADLIGLLTEKSRQDDALEYITPGLDNLTYIQSTSDIFFPNNYIDALLKPQISREAQELIRRWLDNYNGLTPALRQKVKGAIE